MILIASEQYIKHTLDAIVFRQGYFLFENFVYFASIRGITDSRGFKWPQGAIRSILPLILYHIRDLRITLTEVEYERLYPNRFIERPYRFFTPKINLDALNIEGLDLESMEPELKLEFTRRLGEQLGEERCAKLFGKYFKYIEPSIDLEAMEADIDVSLTNGSHFTLQLRVDNLPLKLFRDYQYRLTNKLLTKLTDSTEQLKRLELEKHTPVYDPVLSGLG